VRGKKASDAWARGKYDRVCALKSEGSARSWDEKYRSCGGWECLQFPDWLLAVCREALRTRLHMTFAEFMHGSMRLWV
jgi:hypothetical protein